METELSPRRVVEELAAIGFADITDAVTVQSGTLVVTDLGTDSPVRKAIASLEKTSTGIRVKFYDKLKALELLGKAVGLFDGNLPAQEENNLLEAILLATGKEVDTHDLPEVQQTAADGHDLVEPAGI